MICYLSGKISGLTEGEYTRNFALAERHIYWLKEFEGKRDLIKIINPLDIKPLFGIKKWWCYMFNDLKALRKCTHIAMQPNWIYSKGAWLEYGYAKFILKIPVIYL